MIINVPKYTLFYILYSIYWLNISMDMVEHRLDIAFFDVGLVVVNLYPIIVTLDLIVFKHAFDLSFILIFIPLDVLPSCHV